MKAIKRIFTILITIIIVAIFTYNVYNIINIKVLKKDMTPVFGYAMLEVVSGSMEPTIHVGDIIIIDILTDEYKENDIVTFRDENDALVTHRIISIDKDEMVTKGDNNDSPDPTNKTDNIVGKYIIKISGLGRVVSSFKSPVTMALILVIGILTCVLVSTDNEGKPIYDEDEKEFQEFLKMKNQNKKTGKKGKKKQVKKSDNKKSKNNKQKKSNSEKTTKSSKSKKVEKSTSKNTKKKSSNKKK